MSCNPITAGTTFCNEQTPGIKNIIRLIPLEDWIASTVTVDATSNNIDLITLPAGGKQAWTFECGKANNIIASNPKRTVDGGLDGYDHILDFKIQFKDQAQIDDYTRMQYNKVVAILELNNGDAKLFGGRADATPEPQGLGLRLLGGDDIPGDPTVGGLEQLILQTDPSGPAESLPAFVVDSSFDLTTLDTPTA